MNRTNKHNPGSGFPKAAEKTHPQSPTDTRTERTQETKPGMKKAEPKET